MNILSAKYEILTEIDGTQMLKNIERAGRTAYKSEDKITPESAIKFVRMLVKHRHLSVIEHAGFSVKFTNDRGVSHEQVRHRLSTFTQESTRYCNYSKDKFGNQINVIDISTHLKNPDVSFDIWFEHMMASEIAYNAMITAGETPQIARSVLPNSLKTEIVITANLRQWRTMFEQRTAAAAHPQIREVMIPLLEEIKFLIPVIFDDINP